jgi:lactose/L-arabinose transport system substrate-binding protein
LVADVESWTDPFYKAIAEGEIATLPMAVWMGGFLKSWIAPKTSGKWGVVPLPVWSGSTSRASNDGGSQVAILEQSKNKDLAWTYVKFVLGRAESQLKMYEALDLFPSLESTYTSAVFKQTDPFFGNQNVRQTFAQVVKSVPEATVYSSDYQEMNSLMSTELQKFALGQQNAKDTLKSAAQKIRERTRRK